MKTNLIAIVAATLMLSACGGGGAGGAGGAGGGGGNSQAATYTFVPPKQGQTQSYVYNITDIANATASYNYTETITQVNADGSSLASWVPLQSSYSLGSNTTGYLTSETDTYDASGDITVYAPNDGSNTDCTYIYAAGGRPSQLAQGQSWNDSYTYQCGANSQVQTVTGTFVGIESITVPAGTFNAYKFQYSGSYPIANQTGANTSANYTMTLWLDTDPAGSRRLRMTTQYTYTGFTAPSEYQLINDMQLTAYQ